MGDQSTKPYGGGELESAGSHRLTRRPPLSAAAQNRLVRRAHNGDLKAREELVRTNMRLVVSIASKHRGEGMELEDLISEGVTGLLEGIRPFDPDKGYALSTYATFWIRRATLEAWAWQGRTLRLPRGVNDDLHKLARTGEQCFQELGRQPCTGELAQAAGLERGRVEELLKVRRYTLSLEVPAGRSDSPSEQGERSALGELLAEGEQGDEPVDGIVRQESEEAVYEALKKLPEIESYIVSARYGLGGGKRATLRELAAVLGISPERVRQRQKSAEIKLRPVLRSYSESFGKASHAKAS